MARQRQQFGLRLAIEAHQFGQLRLAQGQVPVLSKARVSMWANRSSAAPP